MCSPLRLARLVVEPLPLCVVISLLKPVRVIDCCRRYSVSICTMSVLSDFCSGP